MRINILEYLEDTAARVPEKLAFSTGKEGMTFSEVQSGAASIGSYIANSGIYREPIVIFMDKHPATVTAFFGVIYSGNFYVCLDEKMPKWVKYTRPEGGLFIWVTLPERFDGNEIARLATEKLVAVVPGSSFEPDVNAKSHSFRLNYSMPSDEQIVEGVNRLAEALNSLENK